MLEPHHIYLYDRIKETSYTLGTNDFALNGPTNGFSSFGSVYSNGDNVFYAATDGLFYEIGSGIYVTGVPNYINRFPFKSSNNNNKVSFGEGVKEIFVTYPATHAVYTASGLGDYSFPQQSGIAFWSSSNIINYDSNIIWDSEYSKLGIKHPSPVFAIDIGGDASESIIRSSGLYVGLSGVYFPSGNNGDSLYIGGTQLAHYEPNVIDSYTGLNHVIELSGIAKNNFLLKKQNSGLVFAGPPSGCILPCSPDYPSFRPLVLNDIQPLVDISGSLFTNLTIVSGLAQYGYNSSGVLRNDLTIVSGLAQYSYNSSGVLRNDITTVSGIAQYGYNSSGILRNDLIIVSGLANYNNQISYIPSSGLIFEYNISTNGIDPFSNIGALLYKSITDTSPREYGYSCGSLSQLSYVQKVSNDDFVTGMVSQVGLHVSGITTANSGSSFGGVISNLRNSSIGTINNQPIIVDEGLLSNQCGLFLNYGIDPSGYKTPTTSFLTGLTCYLNIGSGTIVSGIDLLFTHNTNFPPNTTYPSSHFGIYQDVANSNYKNYLNGKTGIKTNDPIRSLDIADSTIRLRQNRTITNSTNSGEIGDICWDSQYIYVCVGTNSWKRTPLSW